MNERIKELAEQATEYANEQNELHGVGYVITFKEKFAELIVRDIHQYVDGLDTAQVISNGILRRYNLEEQNALD
jgi:hypothetical protein